ncbi:chromo domain-containing protein 1, partial [Cladorrhinum sp. PSN259]
MMFQRRGVPRSSAESDEDPINLVDTDDENDPDKEYGVEDILAERVSELDGRLYYLVEWVDYDKLKQSTWEPADGLGEELRDIWEKKKAEIEAGKLEPFDLGLWEEVQQRETQARNERHRRRNAKRKRLGLPLVVYPSGEAESPAPSHHNDSDQDSSYDEAVGEPATVELSAGEASSATKPRQPTQQRGVGRPSKRTASPPKDGTKETPQRSPGMGSRSTAASASSLAKKTQSTQPSTTGYQGTARKASKDHGELLLKSKTQGSTPVPSAILASSGTAKLTGRTAKLAPQLKAKRSAINATGNIFTSGKTTKQRASLREAMTNESKSPHFFQKARHLRKAHLASRSKEDIAPDPSKLPAGLFPVTQGPAASRRVSKDSLQSPLERAQSPYSLSSAGNSRRSSSNDLLSPAAVQAVGAESKEQQPEPRPRPPKKRKSVRFAGVPDEDESETLFVEEPELMDIDSTPREAGPSTARHDTALKKSSLPVGNLTSPKTVIFGQSPPINVLFSGLPDSPTARDGLLANFLALEKLEFQYTCLVQTSIDKIKAMIARPLATGQVLPKDDSQALEVAAKYLRARLIGIYSVQSHCHILIYPTKCEEWDSVSFPGQEQAGPAGVSEAHLRFYVFDANVDLAGILPPFSAEPPPIKIEKKSEEAIGLKRNRRAMMKRLFNFDYQQLLPHGDRSNGHVFFLAIPEARQEALMTLCQWLRSCDPKCQIFCSDGPGSWAAFRSTVDSSSTPGVIIVHEILAWSLARFPNLAYYLASHRDEYWCLAEPIYQFPMYPSMPLVEEPAPPGDFQMARLFPHRTVVLLTPSFLVSEPRRAEEFIDWFLSYKAKTVDFRLVTAFNIHDYLFELAREKRNARSELKRLATQTREQIAIEENLQGLSEQECADRFLAATRAAELHHMRERKFAGLYGDAEDKCSLIYADQCIDPNDEQSLVNWFGWWTSLRADQFRNFYVVGSSETIKRQGSKRSERWVKVPKYSKMTLNDPDAVMEVFQEQNNQAAKLGQAAQQPQSAETGNNDTGIPTGPRRRESWSYRSRILENERSESFNHELSRLEKRHKAAWDRNQWVLNRFVVSWMSPAMADHYQDPYMRFNRIRDWHSFAHDFNDQFSCHTYMGYFYTTEEEFDPDNPPRNRNPDRHPWLAIWRQENLHVKPWSWGRELLIWDPSAQARFGDARRITKEQLPFMQRILIDYLAEHAADKRAGAHLSKVYYGGFHLPPECDSDYPIDLVFQFISAVLCSKIAFKRLLPVRAEDMGKAGFRKVSVPGLKVTAGSPSRHAGTEDMDLDTDHDEFSEDEDTRIIFHPPRGLLLTSSGSPRSKCTNRLYEAARINKSKYGPHTDRMEYAFRPTSDWYNEQRAEGRDYSHIHVDSWEKIFD